MGKTWKVEESRNRECMIQGKGNNITEARRGANGTHCSYKTWTVTNLGVNNGSEARIGEKQEGESVLSARW